MRSAILTIFLAALAGNAAAAWTVAYKDNDSSLYVDNDAIWRSGNIVKMWSMYDNMISNPSLNPPGMPSTFLSTVSISEYDCVDRRVRLLQGTAFEGNMGKGAQVWTLKGNADWEYAKPGSANEIRLKIACKKR